MNGERIVENLASWSNDALAAAISDKSATIDLRDALAEFLRRDAPQLAAVARRVVEDTSEPSELRSSAALALGCCRDSQSQKTLVDALSSDDERLVQRAAASLGKIGDEAALAPLRAADAGTNRVLARTIAFAETLICHRLGLVCDRLARPASSLIVTLDRDQATPMQSVKVSAEAFAESATDLAHELPVLPVASFGSVRLSCHGELLWVVLPNEIAEGSGKRLKDRSAVAAVVLKQSTCSEHWYVHEYLLTKPADDGSIEAYGVRPSGRAVHFGQLVVDSAEAVLTLKAIDSVGTAPIDMTVGYASKTRELAVREALSTEKASDTGRDRLKVRPDTVVPDRA